MALVCLLLVGEVIASPQAKTPDFDAVAKVVRSHFASRPGYQDGDLISRSQIDAVLESAAAAGWKVHNGREIVELGLPDNSFLVRELSTPTGRKFMRKIATLPGGYSHLDRLTSIPRGEAIVRELIRKPGGDEMVAYLATTKGGRRLGKSLSGVRGGADVNKPTGRVYTADDLLDVLQQAYKNRFHNL